MLYIGLAFARTDTVDGHVVSMIEGTLTGAGSSDCSSIRGVDF
jgi:hypothetical protein